MPAVLSKLKSLGGRLARRQPPLPFPEVLNIEVSYACNLKCVMCPRHFDDAPQKMFSMDLFREKVVPALGRFKKVHLTGWGEPLMNKHLPEIAEECKKAGLWVAITSNGLLLREPMSKRLVDAGVDHLNISCDAAEAPTYEYVRGKGTFDQLMARMTEFLRWRKETGAKVAVSWTFVMLKPNIHELPSAVRRAAAMGYDKFYCKHMETAVHRDDLKDALFDTGMAPPLEPEWEEKFQRYTAEAVAAARETGIEIEVHPRRMAFNGNQCMVMPLTNVFIDYEGRVSSCCYLHALNHKPYIDVPPASDGVLGDLRLTDFVAVLDSQGSVDFRRQWQKGEVPAACVGCLQVNRMGTRA